MAVSITLIIFHLTAILSLSFISTVHATVDHHFTEACSGPQKSTKISFYLHAIYSGVNQSVYEVARSSITATSPTQFGLIYVVDAKSTTGPDYNSQEVARAQGVFASSDLTVTAFIEIGGTVHFTAGKFNGSTLTVIRRNPLQQTTRELAVVGGTGMFRCARGYAIDTLYSTNSTTSTSVFQPTIYTTYIDNHMAMLI